MKEQLRAGSNILEGQAQEVEEKYCYLVGRFLDRVKKFQKDYDCDIDIMKYYLAKGIDSSTASHPRSCKNMDTSNNTSSRKMPWTSLMIEGKGRVSAIGAIAERRSGVFVHW